MLDEVTADGHHEQEREPHDAERGEHCCKDCCPFRIASIDGCGVACVGGGIDSDRSGCSLAHSHDVGKLACGEPLVLLYHLMLDERYHGVASAKIEDAYL